jgi:hypothetical protein
MLPLLSCNILNDHADVSFNVGFTKKYSSDTVSVAIDGVLVMRQSELNTWGVIDHTSTWIDVYVEQDKLRARFMPSDSVTIIGKPSLDSEICVYHKANRYVYHMNLRKGKWLLVSLDSTIKFEQRSRPPIFD